jgi:predicted PurR-regulated permease PerM
MREDSLSPTEPINSPRWGPTTKLVVALTMVAAIAALLIRFQFILPPLLIAILLAYLLYPIASFLQRHLHFSWGLSVGLLYLIIVILLLGLLTAGGLGLIQQAQSVVRLVQEGLTTLPDLIAGLNGKIIQIGPFRLDFNTLDLNALSRQALDIVQPLLSRTGSLLSTLAGSAATFLGWTFFVLLVSYFILSESGGLRGRILNLQIPGYTYDLARLGRELGYIWNAFLRGQIIIFFLTVLVYLILLSILGVRYAIGLAFLAGLARFVPYVGPAINWTVLVLVAYFQDYKLFNLPPLTYALLVLGLALLSDQIFDNFVSPRVLSKALKVHPAGVLIAAIIAANLLGIIGVVVAAPILATFILLWRYLIRKMLDLDPWPEPETRPAPLPAGARLLITLRRFWRDLRRRFGKPA